MASTGVGNYTCAVHLGSQRFEISRRAVEESPGAVLVEVLAAGICGTDLAITATPPDFEAAPGVVLGHEIVGTVVSDGFAPGRRVIVIPSLYCGECAMCVRLEPSQCLHAGAIGVSQDGGFAEFVSVPRDKVLAVTPDLEPRTAVLAEPLACVLHGIARTPGLVPNGVCVVLGAGPIGALFALVLERAAGQRVIVSEPAAARASLLTSHLTRGRVVSPSDLASAVDQDTRGLGAPVVIDAVGSMLGAAVAVAAPRGTVHSFGMHNRPIEAAFQQQLTVRELTVTSAYGPGGRFAQAVELLEQGLISAADLVTRVFPLDDIDTAFTEARSGSALKVLIEPRLAVETGASNGVSDP